VTTDAPVSAPPPASVVEYPVFFVPELARQHVRAASRNRTWRIVSTVISLGITFAIYWFFREQLGALTWPVVAISAALPLAYLIWAIVGEVAVRRSARTVHDGLALGVGREGVGTASGWWGWDAIAAVRARSRRFGRSDDLIVEAKDGRQVALPLAFLSDKPATIDSAIRALSNGRVRVDFSKLDA